MVHRNAPLSETGRLRLARCVVQEGWPLRRAAERFQVSHSTASEDVDMILLGLSCQAVMGSSWPDRTRQEGRGL